MHEFKVKKYCQISWYLKGNLIRKHKTIGTPLTSKYLLRASDGFK